jgi:hypothetical protein
MQMLKIPALFVLLMAVAIGCKKDKSVHSDAGYGYFPTTVGHFVIYDVDSTIYNAFNHDTVYYRYQLKELIESEFQDNEGRVSQRVERYVRSYNPTIPYDSLPWTLKNVWYVTRTSQHAELVTGNIRYVRLIFPVIDQAAWNGNAQNTQGDWEYQYQGVHLPFNGGNVHSDSSATVIEKDETDLLNRRYYKEVYAKNIGLVLRQIIDVYDTKITPVPVIHRIKGGVIYMAVVHSYGMQ